MYLKEKSMDTIYNWGAALFGGSMGAAVIAVLVWVFVLILIALHARSNYRRHGNVLRFKKTNLKVTPWDGKHPTHGHVYKVVWTAWHLPLIDERILHFLWVNTIQNFNSTWDGVALRCDADGTIDYSSDNILAGSEFITKYAILNEVKAVLRADEALPLPWTDKGVYALYNVGDAVPTKFVYHSSLNLFLPVVPSLDYKYTTVTKGAISGFTVLRRGFACELVDIIHMELPLYDKHIYRFSHNEGTLPRRYASLSRQYVYDKAKDELHPCTKSGKFVDLTDSSTKKSHVAFKPVQVDHLAWAIVGCTHSRKKPTDIAAA